jgi:triphosphatase
MPTVRSEIQSDLTSTYYDTPDLALHRRQLTLRVRKQGRKFVQTVKADLAASSLLLRREWEDRIAVQQPDIDAPKSGKRLPKSIRAQDLRPVFTTSVTRTVIEIEPHASTRIEAAVDEGEIRSADGSSDVPISEIELELKSGDSAALFDLALRLLEAAPVRIETRNKPERGYRLIGAAGLPQAVYAGPVVLDPAMAAETACNTSDDNALPISAQRTGRKRVAARQLRSVLSALKPLLPWEQRRWASEELKWLTHALDPARNWDVFADSLLRPGADALSEVWTTSSGPLSVVAARPSMMQIKQSYPNDTPNRCCSCSDGLKRVSGVSSPIDPDAQKAVWPKSPIELARRRPSI